MSIIIAGGGGFIGSKLARRFLEKGRRVLVLDNMSRGRRELLPVDEPGLEIQAVDLADAGSTLAAISDYHRRHPVAEVWHMAANSDIPAGIADVRVDLRDTFLSVVTVIEAMKGLGLTRLAFASSSAIYGDHGPETALREDLGPLLPISNYGAMKLAAEALISASAESFLEKAWIFRFPNVVGTPATHGVILDFIRKLKDTPGRLEVLGNGSQQKAYLHVGDLVEAMLFIADKGPDRLNLYNIGPDDAGCRVSDIAEAVRDRVSPGAAIAYGSEGRGWVGDVPKFRYCVDRLAALGWRPGRSSLEAMRLAVDEIAAQEGF